MAMHRTAMGKMIDMDMMRLANETSIAVGNMKTNARGDELGEGGKIIRTRADIMRDYYALNQEPVSDLEDQVAPTRPVINTPPQSYPDLSVDDQITDEMDGGVDASYSKPRGSLADTVAQTTEVTQTLLTPPNKDNGGVRRI